jgi:hypothetical protein
VLHAKKGVQKKLHRFIVKLLASKYNKDEKTNYFSCDVFEEIS